MEEPSSISDTVIEQGVVAESPKETTATCSSDETPSTDNSIGNDITVMADSSPVEKMEDVQTVEQQSEEEKGPEQGEGVKLKDQPMDTSEVQIAGAGAACSAMDTETGEVRGAEGGIPEESTGAAVAAMSDAVASGSATASPRSVAQPVQAYHVKWVSWRNQNTPIITQNENGPCPLIAIVNVMLLRETIQIPQMVEMVSASQLFEYLGDHLLSRMPKDASDDIQKNYEQNMHDAMEIMSRLQTGLDVNVKFTGVKDFEYTQECVVFDLLNIALYHGWLYDPQNLEVVSAVGTCSYNQLVERIIATKSSSNDEDVRKARVGEADKCYSCIYISASPDSPGSDPRCQDPFPKDSNVNDIDCPNGCLTRRKRGRPKPRGLGSHLSIEEEMKSVNITWGSFQKKAQNRQEWRSGYFVAALHARRHGMTGSTVGGKKMDRLYKKSRGRFKAWSKLLGVGISLNPLDEVLSDRC
nr:ubiquitin carboxyl-terminal hydrolase MINDY-2-like [Lytechinus pictus]